MRLVLCLLAALFPLAVAAEPPPPLMPSTISLVGEAKTKIAPDQATVPVIITTESQNLTTTKKENDDKVKKVLEIAQNYGVAKEDIQTEMSSVEPKYDYGQNITTQIDVYSGNISFSFDVAGLSDEKIDDFVEKLQQADLENIGNMHQNRMARVSANYNVRDESASELKNRLHQKETQVLALASDAGIDRSKIINNRTENKVKETRNTPPKQRIDGYTATVALSIVLKDKEKAVSLINDIVKDGVTTIGNVSYSLGNEKAVREKTLLKAVQDARQKAENIADTMDMALDRPLSVQESGAEVTPVQPPFNQRPMNFTKAMAFSGVTENAMAPPPPPNTLPSGMIEINQTVQVTYLLKRK